MEGTIGEIRLFAGNFAPKHWAFCQGQLLSIAQNTALFSILGTTYGGNGQTTFALPDLRGRVPVGAGTGPGLSPIALGEMAGTPTVTLLTSNLPAHTHTLMASNQPGATPEPAGNVAAVLTDSSGTGAPPNNGYLSTFNTSMNPQAISPAGGSMPINIMQPYLGLNYIICMYGLFPARN
jgi:microcystin-dependent protein